MEQSSANADLIQWSGQDLPELPHYSPHGPVFRDLWLSPSHLPETLGATWVKGKHGQDNAKVTRSGSPPQTLAEVCFYFLSWVFAKILLREKKDPV